MDCLTHKKVQKYVKLRHTTCLNIKFCKNERRSVLKSDATSTRITLVYTHQLGQSFHNTFPHKLEQMTSLISLKLYYTHIDA